MNEMLPEIVRTKMVPKFDLPHWYLFGLNIFAYNNVACRIEQRPDVLFLIDLTTRLPCAAHVGSLTLQDRVDSPEEMFGRSDADNTYIRTHIGFSDGFYDLNLWPTTVDACFFPSVTKRFWQGLLKEEDDLEQMLLNHGLAFYLAPSAEASEAMPRLLTNPFPGEAQWLNDVTKLYALVLTVGHDGQFFHVYSQNRECLQLIKPSLTVASTAVTRSNWYQAHKQNLAWREDPDCCLMLPEP